MEEKKTKKTTKTTELATNVSSGAEKVESIAKEKQSQGEVKTKKTVMAKQTTKTEKAKAENARAKVRVEKALKKQELKKKKKQEREKKRQEKLAEKKRLQSMSAAERKAEAEKRRAEIRARKEKQRAEKKARLEKKRAELKARMEKRQAEQKARAEKRKAEREARIRERAHRKANKHQAQHKKKTQRQEKKRERREQHAPGYGGWLAAVIALGAVTLGLAGVVTVGAIEMNNMQNGMMSAYQGATYELTGVMEHVDDDLDRVRLSADSAQQSRILTDILVQARLAEADLEKLPVDAQADMNVTTFVNRLAGEASRMLGKIRAGEQLTAQDYEILQHLYEVNHEVRTQLDEYVSKMCCKDFSQYMKKGKGELADTLGRLEDLTLEENRLDLDGKKAERAGAGMEQMQKTAKIDTKKAEELCRSYFAKYGIKEFQCVGEMSAKGTTAYNVHGYDDKGTQLFAEIDQYTGKLIRFDFYEDCSGERFDKENCARIAEEFLTSLGYQNMTLVRARRNGSTLDLNYVYETDGAVVYPDSVRIKVCQTRGIVSGFDASRYLRHHKERAEVQTSISESEARARLKKGVEVECSRLAIVHTAKGERSAYEFVCEYMDDDYVIYIDAVNGKEIAIINLDKLED